MDIVIKNGTIVDGTGAPSFRGDIGVYDQKIVKIGTGIEGREARVIDVKGMIVSPGFIDMHTHSDLSLFKYPQDREKIRQGVTTALLGQDGLSVAPIDIANMEYMKKRVRGLLGDYLETWPWHTTGEYLRELERTRPATNNLMLVPHGSLRAMTVGWEARLARNSEIDKMKDILSCSLNEGGVGFSSGLVYTPAAYAGRVELVELCRTAASLGGFFVVHIRDESSNLKRAIDEVIGICLEADCPLHISHFKVGGKENLGRSPEFLQLIDDAGQRGLDISFDQYPYPAGSTMLDAIMPPELHKGGTRNLLDKLKQDQVRSHLRGVFAKPSDKWENLVYVYGWDKIMVTAVGGIKNKGLEGYYISDLAASLKKDPVDLVADLLVEEEGQVTMAVFFGREDDVETIMSHKAMCVCSDGILGGKPHPRLYGSFPRVLGRYVRSRKVMSLEEAIKKMTGNPARRLNLKKRGLLKLGMQADITIFDLEKIVDRGTFQDPCQFPEGVTHVLVNGVLALDEGLLTVNRNGQVITG